MRLAVLALIMTLAGGEAFAQAANPEMQRIFAEDQADRTETPGAIDWTRVKPRDQARQAATRKLMADGALTTADDFHAAAFVFQHGDTADDFLLAHTLAMAAVAKGKAGSLWIATATLDRYLVRLGQPQVYGTQFNRPGDAAWTQEPYDRALVPDALRRTLGVPTLAEQARQLSELQAAPKKP